ncbi:MAG: hypothetical protein HZA34_00680 [Candidatus Pacebacteria bacterium]|nr:hypothetical protein [Candidatus Paceibacterota bacterium]
MADEKKRQGLEVLENKLMEAKIPDGVQRLILAELAKWPIEDRGRIFATVETYVHTAPEAREQVVRDLYDNKGLRTLLVASGVNQEFRKQVIMAFLGTETIEQSK